jgi:DNA-binding IclR family transcriptional regulator
MHALLERGLMILEFLATSKEPRSFGDINRELGEISRASLSRLLTSLQETGHVAKDPSTGLYNCGVRMGVFAAVKEQGRKEQLLERYSPLMDEIMEDYDVSVILQERVGDILVCIRRVATEYSALMQVEGHVNREMDQPCGLLLAAYDARVARKVKDPVLTDRYPGIRQDSHVYDDQTLRKNFRRLGFPLLDSDGKLIGCFGLGGSILEITDEKVPVIVDRVLDVLKG